MAKILLNDTYFNIKDKINTIFKKNSLLNIINDKKNNIKSKLIFYIIVLIKYHYTFYIFSNLYKTDN